MRNHSLKFVVRGGVCRLSLVSQARHSLTPWIHQGRCCWRWWPGHWWLSSTGSTRSQWRRIAFCQDSGSAAHNPCPYTATTGRSGKPADSLSSRTCYRNTETYLGETADPITFLIFMYYFLFLLCLKKT